MHNITFLGTAGGRFVILTQRRYSGGIWLEFGKVNLILDPGPGALIRALQFKKNPKKLSAILISHNHLDHYADAEILIEAMTYGLKKKKDGVLVINKETLPYISEYHKEAVNIITPKAKEVFQVKELKIEALETFNHSEGGIGFKFFTEKGVLSYTSDTAYSQDLLKNYENSKILILNTIFPYHKEIETHLSTRTSLEIVKYAKPEIAIITHFGMQMLNSFPEKEAKFIEEKTGVKTIAAKDGMTLSLDKEEEKEKQQLKLSKF